MLGEMRDSTVQVADDKMLASLGDTRARSCLVGFGTDNCQVNEIEDLRTEGLQGA